MRSTEPTTSTRRSTRRTARAVAPLAMCLAVALGASGCGGSDDDSASNAADELTEKLAESGTGGEADVDIDSESGQVDVSTDSGDMSIGEDTTLPDDFPEDVPLPADYELTSAMTSSGDTSGWTIAGTLPDADDTTFDALVAEFTGAGWTSISDASTETGGGTASTAMLDNGTWQVVLSVQVGVEGAPDGFSYLVSPAAG